MAQQYYLVYEEPIPTAQLVQRVAMVMQEYTQSGYECGTDHFKLLLCVWDKVGRMKGGSTEERVEEEKDTGR